MDALIDILFLPPAFASPFTICVLISTAMLMVASSLPKTLHRSICHLERLSRYCNFKQKQYCPHAAMLRQLEQNVPINQFKELFGVKYY